MNQPSPPLAESSRVARLCVHASVFSVLSSMRFADSLLCLPHICFSAFPALPGTLPSVSFSSTCVCVCVCVRGPFPSRRCPPPLPGTPLPSLAGGSPPCTSFAEDDDRPA
eukprot:GGOE01031378.1.p3 GENE.GGOE01031378.1~~GGOE01031378.1.p3  ORF type:complete len:110 (-),score=1.29 GGOE01031378.1:827-1156(-)